MSETTGGIVTALANIGIAFAAGIIGIFTGVRVHEARIDQFEKRLDRIESKLDRLIERGDRYDHG